MRNIDVTRTIIENMTHQSQVQRNDEMKDEENDRQERIVELEG